MDPALYTLFAKGMERAVNGALVYDPGSQAALAQLADKSLTVSVTRPQLQLHVTFYDGQIQLSGYRDEPTDCTLRGSPPALFGLLVREQHTLADTGVTVEGDVTVLHKLQRVLANLDLDWEQALNERVAGFAGSANADLLVHPVAQFLRGRGHWFKRQATTAPDWLRDYLTEEVRLLPSPHEISAFGQDVDELRAATERLEARLLKLRESLRVRQP